MEGRHVVWYVHAHDKLCCREQNVVGGASEFALHLQLIYRLIFLCEANRNTIRTYVRMSKFSDKANQEDNPISGIRIPKNLLCISDFSAHFDIYVHPAAKMVDGIISTAREGWAVGEIEWSGFLAGLGGNPPSLHLSSTCHLPN